MSNKIALVTGGIGGIGTEICKSLYQQGRTVVAGHLPQEQELAEKWQAEHKEQGFEFELAAGNISDFDATGEMLSEIANRVGPLSIVVNCAGITRDAFLKKMPKEDWEAVINTNLNSLFNVCRQIVEPMGDSGWGRIVNISSVNGQKGQFGQTNYSAAKAGVHGFSMALAQEMARKGVTVNSLSPGYVETRMTAAVPEEIREQIIAQVPVGRMAQPAEIGSAVAFLCADESSYITGINLPVNGGLYMS